MSISLAEKKAEARHKINRFVKRFEPSYKELAYLAALPLALTPELLNYLRVHFLRGEVPWVAEVDLLLSDLCRQVGHELYAMDAAVRDCLLQEMREKADGKQRMAEVAKLLINYACYLDKTNNFFNPKEIQTQQLSAMVYIDDKREDAVRQLATEINNAIASVDKAELARLSRLVKELAPQLSEYSNLIDNANLVSELIKNPEQVNPENLQQREQSIQVAGIELADPYRIVNKKSDRKLKIIRVLILEVAVRAELSLNDEIRDLQFIIDQSGDRTQFQIDIGLSVRSTDLVELMLRYEPNIVHFCGYGSGENGLVFRDKNIDTNTIASLFELCQQHLECVVLNACYSEIQANEINKSIKYVIGMNQEIRDDKAIAFSKGFYAALGNGRTIENAFELGKNEILIEAAKSFEGLSPPPVRLQPILYKKDTNDFDLQPLDVQVAKINIEEEPPPPLVLDFKPFTKTFETVTVNRKGEIIQRDNKTANYFNEDLTEKNPSQNLSSPNFDRIKNQYQEGRDYNINITYRSPCTVIVAPHGGKIEPGTSEIAIAIAGENFSYYSFEGNLKAKNFSGLYLTSTQFDEPKAIALVRAADTVLTIHGTKEKMEIIYLGGLDQKLHRKIQQNLEKSGFMAINPRHKNIGGSAPNNICNRGKNNQGVQLEITRSLRDSLMQDRQKLKRFANAIQEPLLNRDKENWQPRNHLEMVYIPEGEFIMGSPGDESQRYDDESRQHKVKVASFWISQTPITNAQWNFVVSLPQQQKKLNSKEAQGKENHPVTEVSWDDAIEFCARLSRHTGKNYRLPSEAEWEYACRAVNIVNKEELTIEKWNEEYNRPFYFGATITSELANYNASRTYANEPQREPNEKTVPVKRFFPNAFGLYDMHGSVFEWCADSWHDNYDGAPSDSQVWDDSQKILQNISTQSFSTEETLQTIPTNEDGFPKILRGGSFSTQPNHCRSANRYKAEPARRDNDFGFRIACSA